MKDFKRPGRIYILNKCLSVETDWQEPRVCAWTSWTVVRATWVKMIPAD